MRSGILFLFLFLVSILVISGCVELGPRKDIKNIMDTSLNLRSGGGSEGASAEISDCDDGIDNNNNGLVDQEDIMCSPRSRDRDFTSCEILFGGFSFSLIPSSAECRNSCEENSFSINSNEGYLQEDYDQNDGNGLSNLDLCGSYALKCCIGQDSQAYNLEAIDLCSLSEPDAWEGCIITEIQYCNTNDECFTGEGEVIIKFGCTNPLACNYDSDATDDNESCELPEENYDCDGNCLNDANSDGICDEYEYLYGCMDPIALNYNPVAEYDGGSCWHDDNIFWLTFNLFIMSERLEAGGDVDDSGVSAEYLETLARLREDALRRFCENPPVRIDLAALLDGEGPDHFYH